jgi:dienelactone hydrolase
VERFAANGFVVLAHDTFAWGSRRFRLDPEPARLAVAMAVQRAAWHADGRHPDEAEAYDVAAAHHEATVAKFAGVMGTSFAGAVAHDDLAALHVLGELPDVDPSRLAVVGFSGGGGRAAVVTALDVRIRASVVVCMMTTLDALYPAHLDAHSWLLATPGLASRHDWTDVAFARGRHDQLVLFAADDDLFPPAGMGAADAELRRRFAGAPGSYRGITLPGAHRFDRQMQDLAAAFLRSSLHD